MTRRDPRAAKSLETVQRATEMPLLHILDRLDWQFVRSLGELQILTRASYVMLGVVPLLAGIWTALPPEVSSSHFLPHSWVFAFLAALAVTLGQVLYQLQGPEIVRRSRREDFERDARREYREQPTAERLERADEILAPDNPKLSPARLRYFYPPSGRIAAFEEAFVEAANEPYRLDMDESKAADNSNTAPPRVGFANDAMREFGEYVVREGVRGLRSGVIYSTERQVIDCPSDRLTPNLQLLQRMAGGTDQSLHDTTKIGYAARKEYLIEASRRRTAMLTASGLYIVAIALIAVITIDQTLAVLQAAGWWRH